MLYRLFRTKSGILIEHNSSYLLLEDTDWNEFINDDDLYHKAENAVLHASGPVDGARLIHQELLPPIDKQEVWASGVTYYRSKVARKEESRNIGGGVFYDMVYDAERPELFFKATAQRTVGSGQRVSIRKDSAWNVPEPELTLFVTSNARIVGYTVGNDMSSRSIEGENPLYLPQAKVYDKSAALGLCIAVPKEPLPGNTSITMEILRGSHAEFSEHVTIDQMKRKPQELVDFLFRACAFPHGCFLMTGTGLVPPDSFTLRAGDKISITIEPIGTLLNEID